MFSQWTKWTFIYLTFNLRRFVPKNFTSHSALLRNVSRVRAVSIIVVWPRILNWTDCLFAIFILSRQNLADGGCLFFLWFLFLFVFCACPPHCVKREQAAGSWTLTSSSCLSPHCCWGLFFLLLVNPSWNKQQRADLIWTPKETAQNEESSVLPADCVRLGACSSLPVSLDTELCHILSSA